MRWVDAQGVFVVAAGRCLTRRGARAAIGTPARDAWRRAYAETWRPVLLDPKEVQAFVQTWQRHLLSKIEADEPVRATPKVGLTERDEP